MQIDLTSNLNLQRVGGYTTKALAAIEKGITSGFTKSGPLLTTVGRKHMEAKLAIKKKSALNAWKAKTFPTKNGKPTAMLMQVRHKWLTIHNVGGVIKPVNGKYLFIPEPGVKRIPYAKFKALLANGDLEVKRMGGKLVVFKTGMTPKGKRRKGKPIGFLVKQTTLKRRLNFQKEVEDSSGAVARLLETDISALLAVLPTIPPPPP